MNDGYVGKETVKNTEGIISPNRQRIVLFGIVLGLLMPPERHPFSMRNAGQLFGKRIDHGVRYLAARVS
jgi:hypothetical protein